MPLHTSKKPCIFAENFYMIKKHLTVMVLTGGMPNATKGEVECQNSINNRILTIKNGGNHE